MTRPGPSKVLFYCCSSWATVVNICLVLGHSQSLLKSQMWGGFTQFYTNVNWICLVLDKRRNLKVCYLDLGTCDATCDFLIFYRPSNRLIFLSVKIICSCSCAHHNYYRRDRGCELWRKNNMNCNCFQQQLIVYCWSIMLLSLFSILVWFWLLFIWIYFGLWLCLGPFWKINLLVCSLGFPRVSFGLDPQFRTCGDFYKQIINCRSVICV